MWGGGGGKGRGAESTLFVSPEIKGDFKTLFLSQRQKAYIFISLECYRKYVTMGLFRGLIASLSKDVGTAHKWVYPPPLLGKLVASCLSFGLPVEWRCL